MTSYAESAGGVPASAAERSVDDAADVPAVAGMGWIIFSGVTLMLAGLLNLVDGLWALDLSDSSIITPAMEESLWYSNSLETWGWIYSIAGVVLILAGIGVFTRSQLARWTGVFLASVSAVINMMWVFLFPIPALIHVALAALVIYGLTAYGARGEAV